jgi:hypothetical protein
MYFGMKVRNLEVLMILLEVKRALEMPAPDKYDPNDRLIKTTRFESRKFGSGSRTSVSKASDVTPGPGAYQNFYGLRNTSTNRILNRDSVIKDSITAVLN